MKLCPVCEKEFEGPINKVYCSKLCIQKKYDRQKAYDASNIEIREEAVDIFALSVALAEEYKKPAEWIQRGLQACYLASVPRSYFIRRYMQEDSTVPKNEKVDEISRQLQLEARDDRWRK